MRAQRGIEIALGVRYLAVMRIAAAVLLTLAFTACDADTVPNDTFRSAPWSKVICTLGTSDRCYAQTSVSPELLHPVVSRCDLQVLVDADELTPTADGWFHTCDPGGKPITFQDVLCFYDSFTNVICYGGSNGWYSKVEPACAPNTYSLAAWPTGACDLNGPGVMEYESVLVNPSGPVWLGRADNDEDAFAVVPSCHVPAGDMNAAANPLACSWSESQPCCACDELGILTCVSFDFPYECPAGTSTTVMACDQPGGEDTTTDTTDGGDTVSCCVCNQGESEAECHDMPGDTCPGGWEYGPLVCTP
jgi:hypothetical protein